MTKQELLSSNLLTARKEKNTFVSNILSTMKGEIENQIKNKPGTNVDILIEGYALKSKKNLNEFKPSGYLEELEIIAPFLPKEITKEDVVAEIVKLKANNTPEKAMFGMIMKTFKGVSPDMVKECLA